MGSWQAIEQNIQLDNLFITVELGYEASYTFSTTFSSTFFFVYF
jgi:hypothetical protein